MAKGKQTGYINSYERTKRFLRATAQDISYCAFFSMVCFYWEHKGYLQFEAAYPMYLACIFIVGVAIGRNSFKFFKR